MSSLTTLIILVTLIHLAALVIMIVIRVRRMDGEAGDAPGQSSKPAPCTVCGDPATHWSYDGLDPNQQCDPHTGRYWSSDLAHYQPLCAAH